MTTDQKKSGGAHQVVLLLLSRAAGVEAWRARALDLAGQGDSVILWDPAAAAGRVPDAVLDLQLAIERAGGISLYQAGPALDGAAGAFGRIDTALAADDESAEQVRQAAAQLERRLRPGRVLSLSSI